MRQFISRGSLAPALFLTGCATTSITDADAIDPSAAYVVLAARASVWRSEDHLFDLTLTCTDSSGASRDVYTRVVA